MIQGSNSSLPKNYLKSDLKKTFEIFGREKVYAKHLEILEDAKIKEKLLEDIGMSKVFSILVDKVHDMATSIGLLSTTPETIKL